MILRSTVTTINRFPQISRQVSGLARRSCHDAAAAGAAAAAAIASGRRMPIELEGAVPTGDGWVAGFVCVHPAAWYQNYGTLGNRERKLKRNPTDKRTHAPGSGITPLYFLDGGKREGRKVQKAVIGKGLPK